MIPYRCIGNASSPVAMLGEGVAEPKGVCVVWDTLRSKLLTGARRLTSTIKAGSIIFS